MNRSEIFLITAIVVALLSASYFLYPLAITNEKPSGAASSSSLNWEYMNHDSNATNFSPQTQITSQNVNDLKLAWVLPFPYVASVPGLNETGTGSITPPLVVNGIVYLETNFLGVYAINSANGQVLWAYNPVLNITGLPVADLVGHIHGINYYQGNIWLRLPDCSIVALNALTGNVSMSITRICVGIPGNAGEYDTYGTSPVFYNDVLITGASDADGSNAGRGFVAAYNITNGALIWRWFIVPPAGGDPNWDSEDQVQLGNGSIVNYGVSSGNVSPYPGDWGNMGFNGTSTLAGGGLGWGEFAVDMKTKLVFVGTTEPAPNENATFRPGPNLFSDSIVALNITNGKMLWYFQTTPHDLYNFDCGWNVVLGSVLVNGSQIGAVFKACKNGYLYALNEMTGKLIWYFNPPAVARLNTENSNYVETHQYNATQPWSTYPSNQTFVQCPGINGGIEADIAYAYGKIYIASYNFCVEGEITSVSRPSSQDWGITNIQYLSEEANTTIYAVDANTGEQVWSYSIPNVPYRGGLMVTDGMVFAGSVDGNIYVLNANSGGLITKIYLGPSLYLSPTIGADAAGNMMLFQLTSSPSYGAFASSVPGSLIAFSLPSESASFSSTLYYYVASIALGMSLAYLTVVAVQKLLFKRRDPKL